MSKTKGSLYLVPTTLGDCDPMDVLPVTVKRAIETLNYFIVENEKTARRFIKTIAPEKSQPSLKLFKLDKYANPVEVLTYLDVCEEGVSVGLLSEAGVPAIADPGADIVKLAHEKGIKVIPLVGPSSIILAMMASGFNGQNFAFNGYLPIDAAEKKAVLKNLEKLSLEKNQSQIFIETPYRNNKFLLDLKAILHPATMLCVACDVTLPTEYIKTLSIKDWKNENPDLQKRPAIFIIHRI
jgi:16S rRNA (cytidine1402-2'-O)-methyltransferase